MTNADEQYVALVVMCEKSQEVMDKRRQEIGDLEAIKEREPYASMWGLYNEQAAKPVELRNRDFSGLLFKEATLENHNFIECDFRESRWVGISSIEDSNCAGSNFAGVIAKTFLLDFLKNTDCRHCDFTNADIFCDSIFEGNNFENANFTNAKLTVEYSFYKYEEREDFSSWSKFDNAIINETSLTFWALDEEVPFKEGSSERRELDAVLAKIFSPEQLAAIHIDYGSEQPKKEKSSGCFIATAACGIDSEEVITLRQFRDSVLLDSVLGRLLVRIYYGVSPPLASLIEGSPRACSVIRNVLIRPMARLVGRKGTQE